VGSSLEAEVEAIEIHFDAYGALHFNGEVCSEGDLPGRLEASLAEDSSRPIRLYGDHKASHGMTARILAATTRAGARSVGIVVQPNQLENLK
jgi:biopolymer transport protein ExbD